jgi:hypothetical protein
MLNPYKNQNFIRCQPCQYSFQHSENKKDTGFHAVGLGSPPKPNNVRHMTYLSSSERRFTPPRSPTALSALLPQACSSDGKRRRGPLPPRSAPFRISPPPPSPTPHRVQGQGHVPAGQASIRFPLYSFLIFFFDMEASLRPLHQ